MENKNIIRVQANDIAVDNRTETEDDEERNCRASIRNHVLLNLIDAGIEKDEFESDITFQLMKWCEISSDWEIHRIGRIFWSCESERIASKITSNRQKKGYIHVLLLGCAFADNGSDDVDLLHPLIAVSTITDHEYHDRAHTETKSPTCAITISYLVLRRDPKCRDVNRTRWANSTWGKEDRCGGSPWRFPIQLRFPKFCLLLN